MITPDKKCAHCDTTLEFDLGDGRRMTFAAHDEAFCRDMTRHRVRVLSDALVSQREVYEHKFTEYRRRVDLMLAENGLPSLNDRESEARAQAVLMASQMDMAVFRSMLGDINNE